MTEKWPSCKRIFHLLGGLLAINELKSNIIEIRPATTSGDSITITIPTYGFAFKALNDFGFKICGVEFISDISEETGQSPPDWRSYSRLGQGSWLNWDSMQVWFHLANSAFKKKHGFCYDLAQRIRYQLNAVNERLRDLSIAYQNQLNSLIMSGEKGPKLRIQNGYTNLTYQRFHSFLFDSCILRDYLSEFLFVFTTNEDLKKTAQDVTTAGSLFKLLKKCSVLHPLEQTYFSAMKDNGWIKELGAYRDLVMHSAPIFFANHHSFCIFHEQEFNDSKRFYSVRFPLPEKPDELFKNRSKKENFDAFIQDFKQYANSSYEDDERYDCLEYAQGVSAQISSLAMQSIQIAPFEPTQPAYRISGGIVEKIA